MSFFQFCRDYLVSFFDKVFCLFFLYLTSTRLCSLTYPIIKISRATKHKLGPIFFMNPKNPKVRFIIAKNNWQILGLLCLIVLLLHFHVKTWFTLSCCRSSTTLQMWTNSYIIYVLFFKILILSCNVPLDLIKSCPFFSLFCSFKPKIPNLKIVLFNL